MTRNRLIVSSVALLGGLWLPSSAMAGCATLRPTCHSVGAPLIHRAPTIHRSHVVHRSHYDRPVLSAPAHAVWHREVADCPPNTSRQFDGTCLLHGRYGFGGYGHSGIGFSSPHRTFGSGHHTSHALHSSFPVHTSGSFLHGSSGLYGGFGSREYLPCPPGTITQPDRTCLASGGVGFGSHIGHASFAPALPVASHQPVFTGRQGFGHEYAAVGEPVLPQASFGDYAPIQPSLPLAGAAPGQSIVINIDGPGY
ncbi:MAG: hypothetical protein AAF311_10480 [Pseudomonadota bacterium]